MEEFLDTFPAGATKWETIRDLVDLDVRINNDNKSDPAHLNSVQLLPRQDGAPYCIIPKIDQTSYTKCKECKMVFNSKDILAHKTCSRRPQNSGDFLDTFPEDATKWETIRDIVDLDVRICDDDKYDSAHKHSVQLLPRKDVSLYGYIPKMDQTSYTKCKECRLIFNTRDVLAHKTCARRSHHSSTPNSSRKSKNKRNSTKKTPTLPPPPLFKKPPSPLASTSLVEKPSPKMSLLALLSKASTTTVTSSNITSPSPVKLEAKVSPSKDTSKLNMLYPSKLPSNTIVTPSSRENSNNSASHTSSSNRHKKSKKNTRTDKVADINDANFGVSELSAKQETFPVKIPISTQSVPIVIEKAMVKSDTKSDKPDVEPAASKSVPIVIPTSPKLQTVPAVTENISITAEIKTEKIEMDIPEKSVTPVPVVYMPVSPISVITYPQVMKPTKDFYVCIVKNELKNENVSKNSNLVESAIEIPITTDTPRLYSIPTHNLNVKHYKSHPKPIAVPTYGTKKIGGAILLSNQRIERQRNDILMALNKNRSSHSSPGYNRGISLLNHTNSNIRPNILKVKSMNKVNCKRTANERMLSTENKQIKLTSNINGFIIHSDMIDTSESHVANNCIQEKIAYFL